jgi:hypothetical protein
MGVVVFKLESEEADAVRGFLKLVDAEKKAATAVGDVTAAGKTANREYANLTRQFSNMEQAADRAWNKQRAMLREAREARFTEPARLRGYDTSDSGAVDFARYQKAQDVRQRRARLRDDSAFGSEMDLVSFRADLAGLATAAAADKRAAAAGQLLTLRASIARTASLDDKARRERAEEAAGRLGGLRTSIAATQANDERIASERRAAKEGLEHTLARNRFEQTLAEKKRAEAEADQFVADAAKYGATAITLLATVAVQSAEQVKLAYADLVKNFSDLKPDVSRPGGSLAADELKLVDALSAKYQRSPEEIIQFRRATGDISGNTDLRSRDEMQQQALGLAETTGSDPVGLYREMFRDRQTYGSGPQAAANHVLYLRDVGGISPEMQADLLQTVLPAGKASGLKEEEVLAGLATASNVGGGPERGGTAFRKMMLGMQQANEKGTHNFSGSLWQRFSQLQDLQRTDPASFQEIAGTKNEEIVSLILGRKDAYDRALAASSSDRLGAAESKLSNDPDVARAERAGTTQQLMAQSSQYLKPEDVRWEERRQTFELADTRILGPKYPSWIPKALAYGQASEQNPEQDWNYAYGRVLQERGLRGQAGYVDPERFEKSFADIKRQSPNADFDEVMKRLDKAVDKMNEAAEAQKKAAETHQKAADTHERAATTQAATRQRNGA